MNFFQAFLIVFAFTSCSFGQDYDPTKVIDPDKLIGDFEILEKTLEDVHPSLYRYASGEDYRLAAGALKAGIGNGLTEDQFHILVRKYLKTIRCGHTYAKPSSAWYEYQQQHISLLPFRIRIEKDRVYINAVLPGIEGLVADDEVISIDGKSTQEILIAMREIQQMDGYSETYVEHSIQRNFGTYYLMLYGASPQYEIDFVSLMGIEQKVVVKGGENFSGTVKQPLDTMKYVIVAESGSSQLFHSIVDSSMCFLAIPSFVSSGYKKFYKEVFLYLEKHGIEHLVLDLRNNGGGYFLNGNSLLQYLCPEPFSFSFISTSQRVFINEHVSLDFMSRLTKLGFSFLSNPAKDSGLRNHQINYQPRKNRFKGRVTVLVNGGTFSMGTTVAAQLMQNGAATIVGEETGGAAAGINGVLAYTLNLPASGVRVSIPHYFVDHSWKLDSGERGVMPHFTDWQTNGQFSALGIQ